MDQLKKPTDQKKFQIILETLSKNLEQLLTLSFAINLFSNMKPSDSAAQIKLTISYFNWQRKGNQLLY